MSILISEGNTAVGFSLTAKHLKILSGPFNYGQIQS